MQTPEALRVTLDTLGGAPFEGVVYRAVFLEYLMNIGEREPQPLYSLGAPASGARFTGRGGMPPSTWPSEAKRNRLR